MGIEKISTSNEPSILTASVMGYSFDTKPDFNSIGDQIDQVVRANFSGKEVAIRCISSKDHSKKSINELVDTIAETGTDRYDPSIAGDRYENIEGKKIDFFALDFKVEDGSPMMEKILEPFYSWPINHGRKPIKLDIAIIYDLTKLEMVSHQYKGRDDIKRDGFVFKNPNNKSDALLGIIIINSLPHPIEKHLTDMTLVPITIGRSGSSVYKCVSEGSPSKFLKISKEGKMDEFIHEYNSLAWLNNKLPVPTIQHFETINNRAYLLMSEVIGEDASVLRKGDPKLLMSKLAKSLKKIHKLQINECTICQRLENKIIHAKYNTKHGFVDESDFDEIRLGRTAEDLFEELLEKSKSQTEDLVFTHGDFCLPNIIYKDGTLSGFIDLGRSGIADRYQDIALLLRSFKYNTNSDLQEVFLQNYGLIDKIDDEKVKFYQLLDEFF